MPADDSMPAEVSPLGLEEVHRPALPLRAVRPFAEQFRHRRARVHPQRQRMAMAAIRGDQLVFIELENRSDADGDRFLPAIEMAEPADLLSGLGVFLVGAFFE